MRISDWSSDVCSSDLHHVSASISRIEGAASQQRLRNQFEIARSNQVAAGAELVLFTDQFDTEKATVIGQWRGGSEACGAHARQSGHVVEPRRYPALARGHCPIDAGELRRPVSHHQANTGERQGGKRGGGRLRIGGSEYT